MLAQGLTHGKLFHSCVLTGSKRGVLGPYRGLINCFESVVCFAQYVKQTEVTLTEVMVAAGQGSASPRSPLALVACPLAPTPQGLSPLW